jgi:hypothetical protein
VPAGIGAVASSSVTLERLASGELEAPLADDDAWWRGVLARWRA